MSMQSLSAALATASVGSVLHAELYPVNNVGKVRVTYNWLYSALNCDPSDNSPFSWNLVKTNTGQVTLSPSQPYSGMTLYASVRPDWDDYVQVQAPHSADWITAAQGDESLTLTELGLLTVNFKGLNGSYIAVNPQETGSNDSSGRYHAGYKLQSNGGSASAQTNMFLAITEVVQANLGIPLANDLSVEQLTLSLASLNVADVTGLIRTIRG